MHDFSDDEDERGGAFSFEHIGRMEAIKTSEALHDIDNLLLVKAAPTSRIKDVEEDEEKSAFGSYYRHVESTGYDAHCERVDHKEIESWQTAFSYFEMKGQSMVICEKNSGTSTPNADNEFFNRADRVVDQSLKTTNLAQFSKCDESYQFLSTAGLSIEGKQIIIPQIQSYNQDYRHGNLEELIAVDISPHSEENGNDARESSTEDMSPYSSRKDEVISLLFDTLWPEIVNVLKPLVSRVVKISVERSLKYDNISKTSDDNDEKMSVDSGNISW